PVLSGRGAFRRLPVDRLRRHERARAQDLRVHAAARRAGARRPPRAGRREHPRRSVRVRPHRHHAGRRLLGPGARRGRDAPRAVRRAVLPEVAHTAPPVRRRGLRGHEDHREGRPGLGVDQVHLHQARDGARLPDARDYADPSVDGHRCLLHRRARALAPLLRDPRPLPHQRADPRPAAAGRRGDGADPQRLHGALRRARRGRPLARLPGPRTAVRLLRGGPPMTADRRSVTLRWLFLAPTMLGVGVFVLVPIVGSLVLALFRWDIITAPEFGGLAHFTDIATDSRVGVSFASTAVLVVVAVVAQLAVAVLLGVRVQGRLRGWLLVFFRWTFFFPLVHSAASVSILTRYLFNESYGVVNWALSLVGIPAVPWLTSPQWALVVVIAVYVWQNF